MIVVGDTMNFALYMHNGIRLCLKVTLHLQERCLHPGVRKHISGSGLVCLKDRLSKNKLLYGTLHSPHG